jgi:hypothetical protein
MKSVNTIMQFCFILFLTRDSNEVGDATVHPPVVDGATMPYPG